MFPNLTLPSQATLLLTRLEQAGFPSYVVGGCVRDSLLGRIPQDWDITTPASPQQLCALFGDRQLLLTGMAHGTVGVVLDGQVYEITTFRVDGQYTGHRRPRQVRFTSRLEEDLSRRDFTVNAMAYHPVQGLRDPFGGQRDLSAQLLRCVGNPHRRFQEDALRILRCLRFAACLGFAVEGHTAAALLEHRGLLSHISPERIRSELEKLLTGPVLLPVLERHGSVLAAPLPELAPILQSPQGFAPLRQLPEDPLLRLTALFCLARQEGQGRPHGKQQPFPNPASPLGAMARLRWDRRSIRQVKALWEALPLAIPATPPALRRLLGSLGEAQLRRLLALRLALEPSEQGRQALQSAQRLLEQLLRSGSCVSLSQLAVSGRDLLDLGIPPGPQLGDLLNRLLDQVIQDALPNQRQELLRWALDHRSQPVSPGPPARETTHRL